MSEGKSVRLFLADGSPGGLLTAEIMNWTGHVMAAPRSELSVLLKRPEVGRTGIYILLGDDPNSTGGQVAYIGEGDDVGKRLYQHARSEEQNGKDFWDRAIVLTSKDSNLTKAHARYLESRMIAIATKANRARLENSTAPMPIALPEADISDMEYFIGQAQIELPVLGVNLLRLSPSPGSISKPQAVTDPSGQLSPDLKLTQARDAIHANAQEVDGEFTVRAGSLARRAWVGATGGYQQLRERLENDGTLALSPDGKTMLFTHDQVFASPSAAAAVILCRSANGRDAWKIAGSNVTYGVWQNRLLEAPDGGANDE